MTAQLRHCWLHCVIADSFPSLLAPLRHCRFLSVIAGLFGNPREESATVKNETPGQAGGDVDKRGGGPRSESGMTAWPCGAGAECQGRVRGKGGEIKNQRGAGHPSGEKSVWDRAATCIGALSF